MAEARSQANWNHTSSIWALFMDIHRDPKKSAKFKLADFNPHLGKPEGGKAAPKLRMKDLKNMIPAFKELAGQPQKRTATLTERIHGR